MSLGGFNVDFIMRLPRTKDEIYDRETGKAINASLQVLTCPLP